MRLRKTLVTRAASILLLAGTLFCAVALPRDAGVRVLSLTAAARSSLRRPAKSLPQSTAGGRIAFAQEGEIYIMNPDGSERTRLTDGDPGIEDVQPALSPDGTRIAFSSDRGGTYNIYVMDADGQNIQQLTSGRSPQMTPAWSPDGSRIAFVRGYDWTSGGVAYFATCQSEIYVMDAAGGKETSLTQGQGGTDPAWSPDGKTIAFSSHRSGNYEIYLMDEGGGRVKQLTFTDTAEADPAWSPDGQFIAYGGNYATREVECGFMPTVREPSWGSDVYVMRADGTDQVRLTTRGDSSDPVWSPSGTGIAFIRYQDDYAQIYCMSADGSDQTRVTDDASSKSYPSWSQWGTR